MADEKQVAADGSSAAAMPKVEDVLAELAATKAELAKVAKANAEKNAEAKANREKAEAAAAEKAAAERLAAEKNGEWAKVLELERAERKRIADEAESLRGKASAADRFEAVFKAEADDLAAKIGERAKKYDHLQLADRVVVLRDLANSSASAGPGAAQSQKVGSPGPVGGSGTKNYGQMSPAQIAALTPKELDEALKVLRRS